MCLGNVGTSGFYGWLIYTVAICLQHLPGHPVLILLTGCAFASSQAQICTLEGLCGALNFMDVVFVYKSCISSVRKVLDSTFGLLWSILMHCRLSFKIIFPDVHPLCENALTSVTQVNVLKLRSQMPFA